MLITFLVSAAMHEFVLAVAFRRLELFFFVGMLLQSTNDFSSAPFLPDDCLLVPLILVNQFVSGPRSGNVLVWGSLFIGQPMLGLLYIRNYTLEHPEGIFIYVRIISPILTAVIHL